ncbi:type II toxin-antitoxin system PemK/MazF family toxin [Corynebacterium uterequi]|uniref:PemK-like protein n=1 Tax=Corynebacterium uterequi TaxID=1072256 RepID=A0A0G3HIA9_9CORY|nr:type II toxin-antitoxin system PemK/MazF family toxin [Corynebacterium uterequi]AKK11613.1 hypothetical protein CUTER_08140 [Corynebacterium uterequi]
MFFRQRKRHSVEDALKALRSRLGLTESTEPADAARTIATITVHKTEDKARAIVYGADIDGQVEAGEVVWLWVPANPPAERVMLVVGRTLAGDVLGLLISPDERHADEPEWISIGTGYWEPSGHPTWIRLDKLIEVPEHDVRREGLLFPERRFDRLAQELRRRFGWF